MYAHDPSLTDSGLSLLNSYPGYVPMIAQTIFPLKVIEGGARMVSLRTPFSFELSHTALILPVGVDCCVGMSCGEMQSGACMNQYKYDNGHCLNGFGLFVPCVFMII